MVTIENSTFIKCDDIFCDIIEVSEPLEDKYLYQFIQTNLPSLKNYINFSVNFIQNISSYIVIAIKSKDKNFILEPQILQSICDKESVESLLFITPNYFSLFFDKKLIYCKKYNKTMSRSDIQEYIQQIFYIEDFKIIELSLLEYDNLDINTDALEPLEYIGTKSDNLSLYNKGYILYTLGVMVLTFMYIVYQYDQSNDDQHKVLEKSRLASYLSSHSCNHNYTPVLIDLFEQIAEKNIQIKQCMIDKKTVKIKLLGYSKIDIYSLTKVIDPNTILKTINFDSDKKIYEAEIKYELD